MYDELTIRNRSALKRFSHLRRFEVALDLLDVQVGEKVLDYGTGDGHLLQAVLKLNPHCEIFGYEPVQSMYDELSEAFSQHPLKNSIQISRDLNDLPTNLFDKICCLEVLEHLTERNQRTVLRNMNNLLNDSGKIVISVPIEVGLSSLTKNVARLLLRQRDTDTSLKNIIKSLFGICIARGDSEYIYSHVGFYYRDLEAVIDSEGFAILAKEFSPFRAMRSLVNSQVFYVLVRAHSQDAPACP